MPRIFLVVSGASLLLVLVAAAVLFASDCGSNDNSPNGRPLRPGDVPGALPSTTPALAAPTATPGLTGPTGSASGGPEHDGARAMAHVQELAKAPRVSGTDAESKAAGYIAAQFRSFGYTTEVQQFEFDGDRFRAGTTTANGKDFEALTLAGSPGGVASAQAVYVGLADKTGIGAQNLKGKIAVADRGTLNFIDKYGNVRDAGAIGLVIVNNRPGPFSGNLTTAATIPVVAVSQEDGGAILEAARAGKTVGINAPPTTGKTKALNVLARPSKASRCAVLVGGHYDSVPGAPGANDNASGTANVLELSRAMAADGLDEGLCFATFGAEESGLYGSKALADQLQTSGDLPRFMLNLDVTGIGNSVEVIGSGEIARRAIDLAKGLGIPAIPSQLPPNSGSDHESFVNLGVPTVFLSSGDFDTIHTPQDVTGDIEESSLDRVGDSALALIKSMLAEVARG